MLKANHEDWQFQLISLASENVESSSYGIQTEQWKCTLIVAVLHMPENGELLDLMKVSMASLSSHYFFGWVIADREPTRITSFKILQPNTVKESPEDALLVLSMGFKVEMPKGVTKAPSE